jgi:nitrogen fixation negative regulator NifL
VDQGQFRVLGSGELPKPGRFTFAQLISGAQDSQSILVEGIIRSFQLEDRHLRVKLALGGGPIEIVVPGFTESAPPSHLLGAKVAVEGVCGTIFNDKRHLQGIRLFVQHIGDLTVEEQGVSDPFQVPLQSIGEVLQFRPKHSLSVTDLVRVRGALTYQRPGAALFLNDGTNAIYITTHQKTPLKFGDQIEVVGFFENDGFKPRLNDALFRRVAAGPAPPAKQVAARELLSGYLDCEFVRTQGYLLSGYQVAGEQALLLQDRYSTFYVFVPTLERGPRLKVPAPGSRLQVTGICSVHADENHRAQSVRVLARSPEDIVVLDGPSWWTPTRVRSALTVFGLAILLSAFWLYLLKREVKRQTSRARQLSRAVEQSPASVIITDLEGNIAYVNPKFVEVSGYSSEEVLGRNPRILQSGQTPPEVYRELWQTITAGQEWHGELLNRKKDGQLFWEYAVMSAIKNEAGVITHFLAVKEDITERKRAAAVLEEKQELLRESETRYRQLVDLSPNAIFIGCEGRFVFINPAGLRLFGASRPEEVLNTPILARIHPDDRPFVRDRMLAGDSWEMAGPPREERFVRLDGSTVNVEVAAAPFLLNNKRAGLVIVHDISERKQLEIQLRQSQKMEAVGQLAGGVAHDFNNILAVIRLNAELLSTDAPLEAESQEPVKQIIDASEHAANLTRQLLTFSRKQVLRQQCLNLNDVVANLSKMLNRIIREDVQLQCSYAKLPSVQGDVGMLEQLLVNLVVNARDALPRGGHIHIVTQRISLNEDSARAHPEGRPGEFVCLSVRDDGTGIETEHLPHIFEPFFTTKEPGKGTGLGLATVYGIAQQHQGWIEVSSTVDVGTTFTVFLPAAEATADANRHPSPEPSPRGGTETILLVEDDRALRTVTKEILQKSGYEVYSCASAREALEVWQEHRDDIALLLTDLVMPDGMNGRTLAERLQSEDAQIRVIFMSGYAAGVMLGAETDYFTRTDTYFLQKPWRSRTLLETIRNCLDNHPRTDRDFGLTAEFATRATT